MAASRIYYGHCPPKGIKIYGVSKGPFMHGRREEARNHGGKKYFYLFHSGQDGWGGEISKASDYTTDEPTKSLHHTYAGEGTSLREK